MYWICQGGKNYGPYSREEILKYASNGTFVSFENRWVRFSDHPDFRSSVSNPPSPTSSVRQDHLGDWYRVDGEQALLVISVLVTGLLLFFFTTITLGFVLFLLAIGIVAVKIQQGNILGGGVKIGKRQFPRIHELAEEAAGRIGLANLPDIFVVQSPVLNAMALGILGRKTVVLHSALIEALEEKELQAIIGHEFSHIKLGHTTWITLIGQPAGIGIPIISQILQFIFNSWSRKAEYSCDRAGLIASHRLNSCVTGLAKLAVGERLFKELNVHAFTKQKGHVEEDEISQLSEFLVDHPYLVNRIHALQQFAKAHPELDDEGLSTRAMPVL